MSEQIMIVKTDVLERTSKTLPLTESLMEEIARFNGFLTAEEVRQAMVAGNRVYTNFSYYERAK